LKLKPLKNKKLSKQQQLSIKARKADMLISMRGADGEQGKTGLQGQAGIAGDVGKPGINGNMGESGRDGARGPVGPRGPAGPKGEAIKGDPGEEGQNGRGISNVSIHGVDLIITFDDGSFINIGRVVGQQGQMGMKGRTGAIFTGSDGGLPWYRIPDGKTVVIPENRQHLISGDMDILGEFIVQGEAVII